MVAGYSFADTPETGVSVSLVTAGRRRPRASATSTASKRSPGPSGKPACRGNGTSTPPSTTRWRGASRGPVVLVEPADNIGGGAPGDCTTVLRAFLRRGLDRAAVVIADAEAVEALDGIGPGERATLAVGGKRSRLDPGPVTVEAELVSRSDGRFTLEDRQSHLAASQGARIEMGPCATVRAGGVWILLTSRKTPPFDLGQLRSQGIVPEALAFIGVKAAVAHRRAYDRIAGASYWVSTPGPCASDLTRLPYRRIRRPIFPLDPPWRPA